MAIVVGLIVALIALIVVVKLISTLLGLVFMVLLAGVIGLLADKIVPGKIPYGILGAVVAGLLGSILGGWVLGGFGPTLWHISIIPAILGTIVLAFGANVVQKLSGGKYLDSGSTPKALRRKW